MLAHKPGEIVVLKTTGEIAFVLDVIEGVAEDAPFTERLKLRVPVAGQGGIHHTIQTFYGAEVETLDEHIRREYSEVKSRQKVMRDDTSALPPIAAPHIISEN